MKKVYLAGPYTGQEVRHFQILTRYAGELMKSGYIVFSPITHSHPVAQLCNMPGDWNFWKGQDLAFIDMCDTVIVLMLKGWKESVGVTAEIAYALSKGKEIVYAKPPTE